MESIKWGIISTGNIAENFAGTVEKMNQKKKNIQLQGVASRSLDKARQFAMQHNIPKAYGSYEELVSDKDIDIVYIATPHNLHYENMIICLKNNKHILCEKSFTVNASQAREVYRLAKDKNLFVMEAFWTKFLPIYREVEKIIALGVIGEIRSVTAQYGFCTNYERAKRKFDPVLAGGALLDIGVYNIGFASMMLGYYPKNIYSTGNLNSVGTDAYSGIMLEYENGAIAQLTTAIQTILPVIGCIYGSMGYIQIEDYNKAQQIKVVLNDGNSYFRKSEFEVNGYEYEIYEAESCIADKRQFSDILTPEQSIAVIEIMDRVRNIWGMKFPCE